MSRAAWKCWKEVPVTEWTGLPKYKSHAYSRMQQVNKRNGVAIVLQPNTTKLQSTVTGMNFTATTNIDWNIWWANRQLNNPSKTLTTRDEYAAEYRLVCWICKQQRKRNRQVKGEQEKLKYETTVGEAGAATDLTPSKSWTTGTHRLIKFTWDEESNKTNKRD